MQNVNCFGHYLAIDFKPNVALGTTFDNGSYCHQTDDDSLSFFNGDMHLFSGDRTTQKVPCGKHTAHNTSISIHPISEGYTPEVPIFFQEPLVFFEHLAELT